MSVLNGSQLLAHFGAGTTSYSTFHTVFHAVFAMFFTFFGTQRTQFGAHFAEFVAQLAFQAYQLGSAAA